MIKVKLAHLLNGTEALQNLSKKELKAKVAYNISKLLKSADKEVQSFNKTRMDLINKYGEKDEAGELVTDENGNCRVPDMNVATFTEELNELIDIEVELNANKIDLEQLGDVEFTPNDMAMLEPFFENAPADEAPAPVPAE